jgi:uncharacterized protein (DUF885 family)
MLGSPGKARRSQVFLERDVELGDRARKMLGPWFDIRKFHYALLLSGSIPLALKRRLMPISPPTKPLSKGNRFQAVDT